MTEAPENFKKFKDEEKLAFALSSHVVVRYVNANLALTIPELHEKLRACRCTSFEAAIIAVLLKAIEEGDCMRLDFLFSRLIGKVKNEVVLTNGSRFENMTTDELIKMKKSLDEANAQTLKRNEAQDPKIQKAIGVTDAKE